MPAPAPNVYPFDSTGQQVSNRILDEIHTLSAVNYRDYHCIIPDFAPYFAEGLQVHYRVDDQSPWLTMNEGIDYYNGFQFVGATKQTALGVYGAICFNNISLNGEIRLSYNTVGGEWTLDQEKLTEILVNLIYNPRTTTWEQVSGAPAHFPPSAHAWQLDDLVGMKEVVTALEAIEDAILNRDADSDFLSHLADFDNPHRTTKSQVGLGRVMDYPPATIAETIAGTDSELYVTPIGLHAYIKSLGLDTALNYVSLEEVVNKISVNKILTFDLFLLYMKLYGGADTAPIENNTAKPNILIPGEGGDYSSDQFFTCNTFTDDTPGSITRTISLTGAGTHTIPIGTNNVRITGRGAIGGESVQPYITVNQDVSGLGSGSINVPAGGSVLSIRARGAAGTQSNTAGIYRADGLGVLNNIPAPNPAPGDPSWSYSIISSFATDFRSNGQQPTLTLQLVVRKNFTNGTNFTADPVTVTVSLANANFSGSNLTYTGSFTSVFGDGTSLSAIYEVEFERLPGTDIIPGASANVTVNGGLRTYSGSSTTSQPNIQSEDIALIATEVTNVTYYSPPGTEVEIIYQDYTANGTWAIRRYYSSKLTNPSTGTSALVEDTTGTVIGLDSQITGQILSTSNTVSTIATASVPGVYQLAVVVGSSNASVRTFEFNFNSGGTPVTIRVVAEFTSNLGQITVGQPAIVNLLGTTLIYPGSADNNSTPEIRSDTVVLNTGFSTSVVYDCPSGASIVLVYNEPNTNSAIVHANTTWQIATSEVFEETSIVAGTELGNGANTTITQWKPNDFDVFVNNTRYFVRCQWVRSDGSYSDWSDTREFTFIEKLSYPPRDTELSRYCKNYDLWGIFSDGVGGNYERIITSNSAACGYVPPVISRPISASGGEITDSNCYRIHTFKDSGTFTVTDAGTIGGVVDYLIVAGGGPGGVCPGNSGGAGACGGGGAGDVIGGNTTVTSRAYSIVVGVGGVHPNNGGDSSAFNVLAKGGGRGGAYNGSYINPAPGGSGGGGGQGGENSTRAGAISSSGLGNPGGKVVIPNNYVAGGGAGGGGAGGAGQDAQRNGQKAPVHGGNGGAGVGSEISGTVKMYGAGGGGAGCNASQTSIQYGGTATPRGTPGIGGSGVGGNGAEHNGTWPTPGMDGTGSGGGGGNGSGRPGQRGGSGIVIVRYRTCVETTGDLTCIEATGGSIKEIIEGGQRYRVHSYLADGVLTISKACSRDKLEYLVIAGGAGGSADTGGGGGAGDAISGQASVVTGSYQIKVGLGGSPSQNGGNSQILNISDLAYGGGAGGKLLSDGNGGGCGGGAGGIYPKPTTWVQERNGGPGQKGSRGGNRGGSSTGRTAAGGGGGMGGPGGDVRGDAIEGGNGGPGVLSNITGEADYYCAGGGGSGAAGGSGGPGGVGGGGNGGSETGVSGNNGLNGTGSGGGGSGGGAAAGSGGSGIVIVRYKIYTTGTTSTRIQATGGTESIATIGSKKYKLHEFNSSGSFNVTAAGSNDQNLEYLIVAGGGGGGARGGGGGGGGVITGQLHPTISNYAVTVGDGGLGTIQNQRAASNGGNSVVFDLVAIGGGAGGNYRNAAGSIGGSGGGAGGADPDIDTSGGTGGNGTTKQGNKGGSNIDGSGSGGGGGGAGAAGSNAARDSSNGRAGNGGIGLMSDITGEIKYYGGGGGGSGIAGSVRGNGGQGGGGSGGAYTGESGTPNTGGGGGAGGSSAGTWSPGGNGGSGKVIIRYEID